MVRRRAHTHEALAHIEDSTSSNNDKDELYECVQLVFRLSHSWRSSLGPFSTGVEAEEPVLLEVLQEEVVVRAQHALSGSRNAAESREELHCDSNPEFVE